MLVTTAEASAGDATEEASQAIFIKNPLNFVGKGTGLRLSICRDTVREHGGHIEASSEFGESTEMLVTLPLVAPALAVRPIGASPVGVDAAEELHEKRGG